MQWDISGTLQNIPSVPRWFINATCYETGKNWRFSQRRMGDYHTGYVLMPEVAISDAIGASAAVPGVIGPLIIRSDRYQWYRYEGGEPVLTTTPLKRYELWDGGVYDNLGIEPLFKPGKGFREGFELLLVSDASALLRIDQNPVNRMIKPGHKILRLIDIAQDQIRGLRSRSVVAEFIQKGGSGAYFRIGNTVEEIYSAAGLSVPRGNYLCARDVEQEAMFPTTLRRLKLSEFTQLRRHGFEVANATLVTRLNGHFNHWADSE